MTVQSIIGYERSAAVSTCQRSAGGLHSALPATPHPALRSEIVSEFSRLEALADDWERLRQAGRRPEIFGSLPFARACWRSFGRGRELCAVVVFNGIEPVAILPLTAEGRLIRFLAAPEADYNDLLCIADASAEVLAVALDALGNSKIDWERCLFENVPEDSNFAALSKALPRELGSLLVAVTRRACPTLVLEAGGATTVKAILGGSRNRKILRRLHRKGELRFRHLEVRDEILRHLPCFFRQHRERRAIAGVECQYDYPAQQLFCEALVDELGSQCVRFSVLELGDRPIAYHFGFEADRKFVFYKQAFDVDWWDASPGLALLLMLLGYAQRHQLLEFDFAVGDEWYKSRFANEVRSNLAFALYRSPWQSAAARAVLRVKAHPLLRAALKIIAAAVKRRRRQLQQAVRHKGGWGTLRAVGRRVLRSAVARDEVMVFAHGSVPLGKAGADELEIRPGTLSELARLACEYPEDLDASRLGRARDRLKRGDRLFFAVAKGEIAHIAWLSVRREVTARAELGPDCRISMKEPVALVDDCWTPPRWRGQGIFPRVLEALVGDAPAECTLVFVCCLASNTASRQGIEKAGFQLAFRIRRLRILGCCESRRVAETRPNETVFSLIRPVLDELSRS